MSDIQATVATLVRECFEGIPTGQDYTWFVQGREGLLDALESCEAADANRELGSAGTIAQHMNHILFALRSANSAFGAPEPEGSWEGTWRFGPVDAASWRTLANQVRAEYERFLGYFEATSDWSDQEIRFSAFATLPHMAYHPGAIRSLMRAMTA